MKNKQLNFKHYKFINQLKFMNLQPTRIESLPARSRKAAEYQILKDYYTAELEKENARLALEEDDGFVADIIKNTKSKINY